MSKTQSAQEKLDTALEREAQIVRRFAEIERLRAEPDTETDLEAALERLPALEAERSKLQAQLSVLSNLEGRLSAEVAHEVSLKRAEEFARLRPQQDAGRRAIVAAVVELAGLLEAQAELDRLCQRAGGYKTRALSELTGDVRRALSRWGSAAGAWVYRDAGGWHIS